MKYIVQTTKKFDRAFALCKRRNYPMQRLLDVVNLLSENGNLPRQYKPHKLKNFPGNNTWECHIQPDWLLVWEQNDTQLTLLMLDTGTHSDIF